LSSTHRCPPWKLTIFATDRESQADPVPLRRVQRVEQALSFCWVDACARIRDRHEHAIISKLRIGGQDVALPLEPRHGLDGITHEIENDLLNLNAIGFDIW